MGSTLRLAALLLVFLAPLSLAQDFQFQPAVPMTDIVEKTLMDVERAGTALVAVGKRGLIIRSEDNGASWSQADVPVSATLSAVHFPTPELGWAAGHGGVILHSADGGVTWEKQFDGNEANQQWLAYTQQQLQKIQARVAELEASGDPEGLLPDLQYDLEDAMFFAEDAQAALEIGPADPLLDIRFTDSSRGWAVGAYGMIYLTTDGGNNWRLAADRVDNPDRFHFYALNHDDKGNLFLSGEAGLLFHSNDNGESWMRNEDVYIGSFFGLAVNGDDVYAFGLRGNIFKSSDAGITWSRVPNPAEFSLYGGTSLEEDGLLFTGTGGGVLRLDRDGTMEASIQSSRATLSGAVRTAVDNTIVLVGMDGVEFLETASE